MGTAGADPSAQEFELAARLAAIVESSGDAILSKALDGVITSWNGGAARIYGYRPEEIIGQNVAVLIPAEQRAEFGPIPGRLRRGERVGPFETKRRRKHRGRRQHVPDLPARRHRAKGGAPPNLDSEGGWGGGWGPRRRKAAERPS